MLVLTRKVGERVRLRVGDDGPDIWVVLVDNDRGKCRLGFDAPQSVKITRDELITLAERTESPR